MVVKLSELFGRELQDIEVRLSGSLEVPVVEIERVIFRDGSSLSAQGADDLPYFPLSCFRKANLVLLKEMAVEDGMEEVVVRELGFDLP